MSRGKKKPWVLCGCGGEVAIESGLTFCATCGKNKYGGETLCSCCLPYVAGDKRVRVQRKLHLDGYPTESEGEFCPWRPDKPQSCKGCAIEIPANRYNDPLFCRPCVEKYQCLECSFNIYGLSDDHLNIRLCDDCVKFHTCIECGERKGESSAAVRCYECSIGSIICVGCGGDFRYNSICYPWKRQPRGLHQNRCIQCTNLRYLDQREQYARLLASGAVGSLMSKVQIITATTPTVVSFDTAVRLYLILERQRQGHDRLNVPPVYVQTGGSGIDYSGGSGSIYNTGYGDGYLPSYPQTHNNWYTRYTPVNVHELPAYKWKLRTRFQKYRELLRLYLGNAEAARIKLKEEFDCAYIAIFYLRWLPQDVIMMILDRIDDYTIPIANVTTLTIPAEIKTTSGCSTLDMLPIPGTWPRY
jgi:hypothetical protein